MVIRVVTPKRVAYSSSLVLSLIFVIYQSFLEAPQTRSCRTSNGSEAVMILALHLKHDTARNRRIIYQKWSVIEKDCLFRLLFVSQSKNDTRVRDSKAETDTEYYVEPDALTRTEELQKIPLDGWVKDYCSLANVIAVFTGEGITTKSAIIQLNKLFGQSVAHVPNHNTKPIGDRFLHCASDAIMSVRRKQLYILDKKVEESSETDVANTEAVRHMLMELQDKIVNPDNIGLVNLNLSICQSQYRKNRPVFLIIFTHSAVQNFQLRQKIRETWANPVVLSRNNAVNMFILGMAAEASVQQMAKQEQDIRQDIVQGDFPESYRNLTAKHRSALKYLLKHCQTSQYQYVLKTDDDIVLDLDGIVTYMKQLENAQKSKFSRTFFCAHLVEEDQVPRNRSFKWFITPNEYPGDTYPPYCYGNAYLMTRDLIQFLYDASLHTRDFWVDDVYYSGFLARNIGNVTHAELPYQHPIYVKIVPPEDVLLKRKWLVHTWQDVAAFDAYWFAFQSRYDHGIRREFVKGVKHRTGVDVPDSVFSPVVIA